MSYLKKTTQIQKENSILNSHKKLRLIFVGENELLKKKIQIFARESQVFFQHYSEEDWATFEDIDQYIQEEEFSKQVISLPVGQTTVASLSELEADAIKKTLRQTRGNVSKAANRLKIARATLYRKIEMYGLDLKNKRERKFQKEYHSYKKEIKKVA